MSGLIFAYLILYTKCTVVLTPSYIRTHGRSHTKGCLPLHFLAVRSDRLTQQQKPEHHFNTALVDTVKNGSASISGLSEIETREFDPYTNYTIRLIRAAVVIVGVVLLEVKSLTCACFLLQWYWHLLD